ncbi:hypothetical protein PPYR_00515 [Photinus pyralis]|uniref:F-box domain-containing protein n=2 Tax=Photinus pyralis TaxID=7054 RepID=A0A1Y1KF37_PHOPY|nr:F-box only protein 39 isoform X1 [Photinus pyralis]KAB0803545.1 hypothetical protein PPYR_00515 [Photinus pyralis]
MLHTCFKCKKDMGNDNCGFLSDWPVAKKSKTADAEVINEYVHNWSYLPSLVLFKIYSMLGHKDRISASSACRFWRQNLYHPVFWQEATFVTDGNIAPNYYQSSIVARLVQNATVKFNSLCPDCVVKFIALLQSLSTNDNLKSLLLQPTYCHIEHKIFKVYLDKTSLTRLIQTCCRKPLQRFSIGGSEDLSQHIPQFLEVLGSAQPEKVLLLGLASVKYDSNYYPICDVRAELFLPFINLEMLSIDYDILDDDLLDNLENAVNLQRLIVHVHGVSDDHKGTTEEAWIRFKSRHADCQLRISFIHAYDEPAIYMQDCILKRNMPLSHLKVFFCEHINLDVLNVLSMWYPATLRSIVWVDSHNQDSQSSSWCLVRHSDTNGDEPNPLVMAAWRCPHLEEIVLLGYKYYVEDLVAIARLRGDKLKVLEVAAEDALYSHMYLSPAPIDEIAKIIGKPWTPLKLSELHPVIRSSDEGDSDEYVLPKVLADLA